jgi:acyl carrier protein
MTTPFSTSNSLSQQVYETLGDYLRRKPSTLHPEDSLRDDLGLDSLQTIELVYEVETAFDLQIPDEDFGRLRTIGDVVTYLVERTGLLHNLASQSNDSTQATNQITGPATQAQSLSHSKTPHV